MLYLGNNLEVLKTLATDSVDLVYLDPPFCSQRDYGEFDDRWSETSSQDTITSKDVLKVIDCSSIAGKGMQSYLIFMAIRLLELQRVLKETGSIYLHCDPTAGHYLKLLMDSIFGRDNFRNEVIWGYEKPRGSKKIWRKNHDTIYFFTSSDKWVFNCQRMPKLDGTFEMRKPFKRPDGSVWHPKAPGKQAGSWWYDIPSFATRMSAKERTGYPTQKPLALLERIIKASSNEGDAVLDPFLGSGTTALACKKTGRRFIGIDCNPKALEITRGRLQEDFAKLELT